MNSKKGLFTTILFLLVFRVFGQTETLMQLPTFDNQRIHWGFYLGANYKDFKINYKETPNYKTTYRFDNQAGFHVGLIGDLRINEFLNLRLEPGISGNTSTLFFENEDPSIFESHRETEVSSTYLHIPLLLKVSARRLNNIKPYLIGGVSLDYNFDSNSKNTRDNFGGEFRTTAKRLAYEIGFGMDFYFHYFKFSPSFRGQFALKNELIPDDQIPSPWTDTIDFMGTRAWFLRLSFE